MSDLFHIVHKSGKAILYLLLLLPIIWILSGFYSVDQNEIAIPVFVGKILHLRNAGIHYNIPYPFGEIHIADIKKSRTVPVGFGSLNYDGMSSDHLNNTIIKYTGNSKETVFLDTNIFNQQFMTGDGNIISIEIAVVFNISSPRLWFFNYKNPDLLISETAQRLLFNLISSSAIDSILVRDSQLESSMVSALQNESVIKECGVQISSVTFKEVSLPANNVENAYRDVKSAEDDRTRRIENAKKEASIIITQGKTEARQLHDSALIDGTNIRNKAFTEFELFTKMNQSRDFENEFDYRLYLSTIESLFKENKTYIIDPLQALDTIFINQDGD